MFLVKIMGFQVVQSQFRGWKSSGLLLFVTVDLLEQCGTALCLQGLSESVRAVWLNSPATGRACMSVRLQSHKLICFQLLST